MGLHCTYCFSTVTLLALSADNNVKLNRNKTKEMVFSSRQEGAPALPPLRPDIERVTSLRVLGVIVNDKLTAADHMTMLLSSRSSLNAM